METLLKKSQLSNHTQQQGRLVYLKIDGTTEFQLLTLRKMRNKRRSDLWT
jgi:hypothetical protein